MIDPIFKVGAQAAVYVHGGPPLNELDFLWREYICDDALSWVAITDTKIAELHLHWQPNVHMAGKVGSWKISAVTEDDQILHGLEERSWPN